MNLSNTTFMRSATAKEGFIQTDKPEIIFAGRSNVGKSSIINMLLNRKNFARVGSTPGKTIYINYFNVDEAVYITDLPGYGYAKRSKKEQQRWVELIDDYFSLDNPKRFGILITDIRRPPTELDYVMANFFEGRSISYIIAANKCDKLSKTEIRTAYVEYPTYFKKAKAIIICSAEKYKGRDTLLYELEKFCT